MTEVQGSDLINAVNALAARIDAIGQISSRTTFFLEALLSLVCVALIILVSRRSDS